ncbi:mRNA capping enzyme [Plasmodium gonderi]|uniref:mRNA 5'-phosphatase n=1 Tax=Plasmodium gonderi TaxID=77519 RepID=A0A1Y1JJH0_PLAGO|nr:mRNA capping enzyme [Plasmodium gonderi]GAW80603.1 mRNA capping enzyme [Plasmodium gonderi]
MVREAHELLDGSRPIPIDKITYELSQNIILAFDNNEIVSNKDLEIEIETRVGLVIDKNKNRIKLPTNTDAIVETNYSDFSSGVDKESFEYLLNYLHDLRRQRNKWNLYNVCTSARDMGNNMSNKNVIKSAVNTNACNGSDRGQNGKNPSGENERTQSENYIYEFVPSKTVRSVDKYYILQNNNSRIRVTTYLNDELKEEDESITKSLCKENLNTWNIFMGNNNDYFDEVDEDDEDDDPDEEKAKKRKKVEHGDAGRRDDERSHTGRNDDSVDYRISINLEHTKQISKLFLSKISPVHERIKERTSFINKYLGIQFDLTKIKHKNDVELYEIEIEILSKSILKAISNLRNKNDSNYLLFICSNLVNNARGICKKLSHFKKSRNLMKQPNDASSEACVQMNYILPSKEKKKFQKYIHSVVPLIGDYMYRVVANNEKKIHAILDDKKFSNNHKVDILKKLIDIRRHNRKSVKKISETYAENRWKVIRTNDSQCEIVLVSDDESEECDTNDEQNGHSVNNVEEKEPQVFNFDNSSSNASEGNNDKKEISEQDSSKYKNFYSDT